MSAPPTGTSPPDLPAFEAALDDAIERLRAGAALEQCLAAHPAYRAELRPLLEVAALALAAGAPGGPAAAPAGAKARVRARIMAAAGEQLARRPWWDLGWLSRPRLQPLGFAAALCALLLVGSGGAVAAAAQALPGEALYPVKLAVEDARLAVVRAAGDPAAQVVLENELASRRLEEAAALAERSQPVPPGVIEAAGRHAAAAEEAVAQLPEPKRARLAPQVATAQAQREATLQRVLDKVPPPAATAAARALERGRRQDAGEEGTDPEPAGRSSASPAPTADPRSAAATPVPTAAPPGAGQGRGSDPPGDRGRPGPGGPGQGNDGEREEPGSRGRGDDAQRQEPPGGPPQGGPNRGGGQGGGPDPVPAAVTDGESAMPHQPGGPPPAVAGPRPSSGRPASTATPGPAGPPNRDGARDRGNASAGRPNSQPAGAGRGSR